MKRIRELEDEALAKELSEKDSQELKKVNINYYFDLGNVSEFYLSKIL